MRAVVAALLLIVVLVGCGGPAGSPTPFPSLPAGSVVVTAKNTQFAAGIVHAPADTDWTLAFDNQDGLPHNMVLLNAAGTTVWSSTLFTGPSLKLEQAPKLTAGQYTFTCAVHSEMHGSLSVP